MCGIAAAYSRPGIRQTSVLQTVLHMLHEQDNRGEDGWGLGAFCAKTKNFKLRAWHDRAAQDPVLLGTKNLKSNFNSSVILGHIRYRTSGDISKQSSQPVQNDPDKKLPDDQRFELAFNGNIANADTLRTQLESEGVIFEGATDTEVLLRLIESITRQQIELGVSPRAYKSIFREVDRRIDGGCSLILADAAGDLVIYRNSLGIRPLWFAEDKQRTLLAANESCAFKGLGVSPQEVPPGEIIWYDRRDDAYASYFVGKPDIKPTAKECSHPTKLDILELIYFQRAASIICNRSVSHSRRRLGREMGKIITNDIESLTPAERSNIRIMAVPNTGIPYAKGVSEELAQAALIPATALVQWIERRIAGRAFTTPDKDRKKFLEMKFDVISEDVKEKSIWLVDDSAVRSDTSEVLTKKLMDAGAKEVHWLICSPPVIGSDYYGIHIPSLEELAFWKLFKKADPDERKKLYHRDGNTIIIPDIGHFSSKMAALIGAASVTYLPLENMRRALPGGPDLYTDHVFSGHYPTPTGQSRFNENLRHLIAA